MRHVLVAALFLAGCTAQSTICNRMSTLCGTARGTCDGMVDQVRSLSGDPGVDAMKKCFSDATTCGEASGCVAGAHLRGAADAAKGFFEGLTK